MPGPFSPDPDRRRPPFRPFAKVPLRVLVPNIVTLVGLCAGLTAIRFAIEERLELAIGFIVVAAILDAIDGRLARMLKGTSKFGAELDSLADFVNFGVAPALILYVWGLDEFRNVGWIAALVFAIAASLRLARFNVMLDDPTRPVWAGNFFTGIPAPAGAITVMLPIYLEFVGVPHNAFLTPFSLVYTLAIAFLMVSRVPTFSGKRSGARVPRERVLMLLMMLMLFLAALVSFPWEVLTGGTLLYLAVLPYGVARYRKLAEAERAKAPMPAAGALPPPSAPATQGPDHSASG